MSQAAERAEETTTAWEWAELVGGPAEGKRVRVAGRPRVLQVTARCPVEDDAQEWCVEALYIYRRKSGEPTLRYGWDWASP
jgi:hypothetical protein